MGRKNRYAENPDRPNGMTGDPRYREQQRLIDRVAGELGVVAFRPDYHGKIRDGNTVLFYLPEDAAYNREVDKQPVQYSRGMAELYHCNDPKYIYRDFFWSFENTDANGDLRFDFANRGSLDLRGLRWRDVLEGAIRLAYNRKMQREYVASVGGFLLMREADDTYNSYNREIIRNMKAAYGKAFLGTYNINPLHLQLIAAGAKSAFTEYGGEDVKNFSCNFVIPKEDDQIRSLLIEWNRGLLNVEVLEKINERVEQIGGEILVWY